MTPYIHASMSDSITAPAGLPVRPNETRLDEIGEIEQQFQLDITGSATGDIAWDSLDITFDVEFIDGRFQRYSNLIEPQMTFGYTGTVPVVITACVDSWVTDDRGVITGATVALGAFVPGSVVTNGYAGRLHLTFQGFGNVPNEPADPDFTP